MKKYTCALTLLAGVLAVPFLPSPAQAAEVSFFRGKTAVVEFYSTDPTGCLVTSVTVYGSENRYFTPPAPLETQAVADVTIHLFNTCTGEQLACGAGSLEIPAGGFSVNPLLTTGRVNAAGDVHDSCTGTERPVTVALTWTGEGEIVFGRSTYSSHSGGEHVWYRQTGRQRDATVTGGMTLDGTPLSLGTGLGYLSLATNGTVTRVQ